MKCFLFDEVVSLCAPGLIQLRPSLAAATFQHPVLKRETEKEEVFESPKLKLRVIEYRSLLYVYCLYI